MNNFECPRCGHCCQALEEKQEPLYWSVADGWVTAEQGLVREWVGLTDEDMEALFLNEDGVRFARYIEAKLKEKNT